MVAALFLVHPLHVESVAWISERKDVLSGCFWMLTLLVYARYTRAPSRTRYAVVAACFGLALMSKPSVVTLPIVLLIVDFWPLNRWNTPPNGLSLFRHRTILAVEKLPFLALSLLVSAVTFLAQQQLGAMVPTVVRPVSDRIGNALVAYVLYLRQTLCPADLAPFYVRLTGWPVGWVIAAGLLLGVVSALVWRWRRVAPYGWAGWLWFLVVLVPMIGIVQVGPQYMADRYTYLSLIGIFIMLVWGAADCGSRSNRHLVILAGATTAGLVALICLTRHHLRFWENTLALCTHAVQATPGNYLAE